jgi:hypothetical protein
MNDERFRTGSRGDARTPSGPAKVLLRVAVRHPEAVLDTVAP